MKRTLLGMGLIILMSVTAAGAAEMIKDGKTVQFDYTLYVDGQVADTSEGKQPVEYVQGQGAIIKGLEVQMEGLKEGEEKTITVAPEEAYGPINPQGIVKFPRQNLQDDVEPVVGMVLTVQTEKGETLNGMIVEVAEDTLTLNFNHPLAGKELKFDVEIVSVK